MGILSFFGLGGKNNNDDTEKLVEAVGMNVDPDDGDYKRLTGDVGRSLNPATRARMQKISPFLWQSNLIANRLIELPVAYLLAEGVNYSNDDEQIKEWLDDFWLHPINNMAIKLEKKVRELGIFGEQFYPAFVNPLTGNVQLSYLDPGNVDEVIFDPRNPEQPVGVKTTRMNNNRAYMYKVIINGDESVFTKQTQRLREGFTDGEIFYFSINAFSSLGRGHGDLTAQADFLDLYDDFIFGEGERASALRSFLWDVSLEGADEPAVTKRAKEIEKNPPQANSCNVHNDKETWTAVTPQLNAGDTEGLSKLFKNHMLAGATFSPSWFADGTDVNKANGEAMAEPTLKILAMRQRYIIYMLQEILTFVARMKFIAKNHYEPTRKENPDIFNTKVTFPEMTAKDISRYATSIQQVVVACNLAITEGLMSKKIAIELVAKIADRLGVEIDVELEFDELDKTKTNDKPNSEVFTGPDVEDDDLEDKE